jgi:predicted RNase H-like HicB family nuclease
VGHDEHEDGHYSMILEWEPEGGVYVVTVPELPGCRTHGRTYEEAVKHGQEVIELWIDSARDAGDPIPQPRYFDLDSIDGAVQARVVLTGDDEDDALPYQERTVRAMLARLEDARRAP